MADGAKVMISSRKEKNVSETLAELRGGEATTTSDIDGMVCHVGKAEHRQALIDRTLEKFGGIDILVSNAGTNPTFGPILNVSSLNNIKKFSELWCYHRTQQALKRILTTPNKLLVTTHICQMSFLFQIA